MRTRRAAALALLAALASGWAFAAQPSTRPIPKKAAAAAPRRPVLSDAAIEAAIRARFAKSKINADQFQVRVQGGVATIEGRTDVVQRKGVATRLAKAGGATAVNNHIQISEAARQKAAANLAKGRRRAQVKRATAPSEVRR
jgi:hypothetical protein